MYIITIYREKQKFRPCSTVEITQKIDRPAGLIQLCYVLKDLTKHQYNYIYPNCQLKKFVVFRYFLKAICHTNVPIAEEISHYPGSMMSSVGTNRDLPQSLKPNN